MSRSFGIWVLLGKLAPKVLPILFKIGKGILSLKGVGVVASAGVYAYLLSWQMGIALTAFLLIHEYGHVWAMRRMGMPVRGMYLIPFFGAVAVPERAFESAREESVVAVMGPLFGFFFLAPATVAYYITGNPIFAGMAALAAFINLVNLFPIYPLDGGRTARALSFSLHSTAAFYVLVLSFILGIAVSVYKGWFLLTLMAFMGFGETLDQFKADSLKPAIIACLRLGGLFVATFFFYFLWSDASPSWLFLALGMLALVAGLDFSIQLYRRFPNLPSWAIIALYLTFPILYAVLTLVSVVEGVRGILRFRVSEIRPPENYSPMSRRETAIHGSVYLFAVAAMIGLMMLFRSVPGLDFVPTLLE